MNKYYQTFIEDISWFNMDDELVEIFEIEDFSLSDRFQEIYPITTKLINSSIKTGVKLRGISYILFSWEIDNEISGWMCQFDKPTIELIEEHQILINNIGGIIESSFGPESIEVDGIDYNYALTLNQESMFVASLNQTEFGYEDYYHNRCKELNLQPIDLTNKVYFTEEANGAKYFYDRVTKEVGLFSHDHAFKFVDFMRNQPEYTMHTIQGIKTFVDFVELLAKQWTTYFETKSMEG